jgi:hypothetical protein
MNLALNLFFLELGKSPNQLHAERGTDVHKFMILTGSVLLTKGTQGHARAPPPTHSLIQSNGRGPTSPSSEKQLSIYTTSKTTDQKLHRQHKAHTNLNIISSGPKMIRLVHPLVLIVISGISISQHQSWCWHRLFFLQDMHCHPDHRLNPLLNQLLLDT